MSDTFLYIDVLIFSRRIIFFRFVYSRNTLPLSQTFTIRQMLLYCTDFHPLCANNVQTYYTLSSAERKIHQTFFESRRELDT